MKTIISLSGRAVKDSSEDHEKALADIDAQIAALQKKRKPHADAVANKSRNSQESDEKAIAEELKKMGLRLHAEDRGDFVTGDPARITGYKIPKNKAFHSIELHRYINASGVDWEIVVNKKSKDASNKVFFGPAKHWKVAKPSSVKGVMTKALLLAKQLSTTEVK